MTGSNRSEGSRSEGSGESPLRSYRVSPAESAAWEADGFFVRPAALRRAELTALRHAAERVVARAARAVGDEGDSYFVDGNRYHEATGSTIQFEHAEDSRTIRVIEPFHHLDERLDRLVDDPRLVEPMCDLIGVARVALFTDKLNLKRPREGSAFRWHQDSPYWAHFTRDLDRLPNVMVTLDDADEHNGCFCVVRGSQRRGLLPGLHGQGRLGPLFTDPEAFDLSQRVPIEAPAGSLVFFSPHTVHGSAPNRSDRPRRALVLTYQPSGRRMFKVDAKREAGSGRPQRSGS